MTVTTAPTTTIPFKIPVSPNSSGFYRASVQIDGKWTICMVKVREGNTFECYTFKRFLSNDPILLDYDGSNMTFFQHFKKM